MIRGTGLTSLEDIPEADAIIDGTEVKTTAPIPGSAAFTALNATAYFNPFTICWEISWDNGTTWEPAGGSASPIFVCLTSPIEDVVRRHTVVKLACSVGGATSVGLAAAHTWSLFTTRNIKRAQNGAPLYYYRPGESSITNANTTAGLLASGTGQCGAWVELLRDAFRINGLSIPNGDILTITPTTGYQRMWVKNWSKTGAGTDFIFNNALPDMYPAPTGGVFGDFTNQSGIPGQSGSSGGGTPLQKAFINHKVIVVTPLYLDPSYGANYTNLSEFVATLYGYGTNGAEVSGKWKCQITNIL